MTKDEALKLALEALGLAKSSHNMVLTSDPPQSAWRYHNVDMKLREAITVIREALAQPETVSPGGGLVPAVPVAVYGYCPVCGGAGVMRERRPNGDDKCTNGHKYPSSKALAQPEQEPVAQEWRYYFSHSSATGKPDEVVGPCFTDKKEVAFGVGCFDQTAFFPPQRKPLTDEEIDKLPWEPHEGNPMTFAEGLRYFARAIEAAHGIKE